MQHALIIDHILGNVCFILSTINQGSLENKSRDNYWKIKKKTNKLE